MASPLFCIVSLLLITSQLCTMEAMMTEFPNEEPELLVEEEKHEVHIVYLGGVNETTKTNHEDVHVGMLSQALGSMQGAYDSILYSYKKSFNGFAAVCSQNHAEMIRGMDGVVSVFKSQIHQHHTTASWEEYLGLRQTQGIWPESNFGNGIIVGMIDSGIWPESKSFNDDGFGPIPSKWKGSCPEAEMFSPSNCNKKLIGAKFFAKGFEAQVEIITAPEYKSPRDAHGHGTHTSSTAAGARVDNASLDGLANGTATGGAPLATIAMYKVCFKRSRGRTSCTEADILAAMDEAIVDGVDLMSISVGGPAKVYAQDSLAIGAFHAVEKGILVVCATGNRGPKFGTVSNLAPWIFTVGASSINRQYETDVHLEQGAIFKGFSINPYTMNSSHPIVYGGNIAHRDTYYYSNRLAASMCLKGYINPSKAKGKIILCLGSQHESANRDEVMLELGAKGYISFYENVPTRQWVAKMPNSNVDDRTAIEMLKLINSTKSPMAMIDKSVTVFDKFPAPVVAHFSSMGPNMVTADILKPDITAPGVNILAAWSPVAKSRFQYEQNRDFNIISGTSMACPHVAGTAALVKSVHLDWTPAAIKSAIMTTARPLDTTIPGNGELGWGSGEINPTKAADPGLIFNLRTIDYINFMCSIGYTSFQVQAVSGGNQKCPDNPTSVLDLNYPSIYISSNVTIGLVQNITRTVTNVGPTTGPVKYSVRVVAPTNVAVEVVPSVLEFKEINEEQSFNVILTFQETITSSTFGSITWNDANYLHSVRMPIGLGPPHKMIVKHPPRLKLFMPEDTHDKEGRKEVEVEEINDPT